MRVFAADGPKNTLVVGAGQGIGLAFVQHLLKMDEVSQVFASYRSSGDALKSLTAYYPTRLHLVQMDITEEAQVETGLGRVQQAAERLHLVVNCVGFLHRADGASPEENRISPEKSLRQIDSKALQRYFQVNSISAILLAKHLLPLLDHTEPNIFATLSAKIGSIGDNRLGGWYGYRASKAALNMLLKTASIEYGRRSKQTAIVMLHPGTTDTQLSKPFQRSVPPEKLFSPERTVSQLMSVLAGVTAADTGSFYSWDGSQLPW